MKFGKTEAQIQKECREYIAEKLKSGLIKFAWRPVKLTDGTHVWLEKYWVDLRCRDVNLICDRLIKNNIARWPQRVFSHHLNNKHTLEDALVIKLKR